MNSLAVGLYQFWEGLRILPHPGLTYHYLTMLRDQPQALETFLWCMLFSTSATFFSVCTHQYVRKHAGAHVWGKAHFSNALETHRAGLFSKTGLVIGKAFGKTLRLPGFESVLVTAPTGSGKTTSIAIPNLLEWAGSGLFNDLKGELYATTAAYRTHQLENRCYRWAPASETKHTHGYNPFAYVSADPALRIRDLQLIAEIIIPAERVDGGFWYTSSRDLFLMLALYLLETTGTATLADIHDLSKHDDLSTWLETELTHHTVNHTVFIQNAHSFLNTDAEKTRANILKDFHSRMVLFADPLVRHATQTNDFDLRQLRTHKMSVYIHIPDADKNRLKPILTLFWAQVITLLSRHEPDPKKEPLPVLALLDEFGTMARINPLKDGLSFLRSYRVRCIVIVQYLSQIKSIYGPHDAKGFLNCKVKIAFALNDIEDARFFSDTLGKRTIQLTSKGNSTGHRDSVSKTTTLAARPLMTPDELMTLKSQQSIIVMEALPPIKAKKCTWYRTVPYNTTLPPFLKDTHDASVS